ncbi:adenosine deaminase [Brumicola nitratireducens]|uniref:adenosine deaminase n=1 Tax=Glaciecola nitratireducens (strain JCM 12485 / KCTC 12276 / FR1064) TaxID=1085623 RepID=G4QGS0_GLANF|nr:adenosine deaminase [Glaciecola nitratireducens]AEP29865.1 adenosine deaminase [Glaciecola nitratireducens FR1064]
MYNKNFPLVDLHRHLDGNIPPKLIWQLAREQLINLPFTTESELADHVFVKNKTSDLLSFLNKLEYGVSVLGSPEACYRVAFENVAMAKAEGIDYTELRFSPFFMARAFSLPLHAVVEAVVEGVKAGNAAHDTNYQLIGILSRTFGVESCHLELASILAYSDHIVALDLAGDELNYPAHLYIEHFQAARAAGLQVSVHAGEAAGPESVWEAIELLGAKRIGHGVAVAQDQKLIEYMLKHDIGIESCLTSNYQTGAWVDTANHPIKTFLEHGLSVSLNTDDPGISNIDIKHEYSVASKTVNLNEAQIQQIQLNGQAQQFLKT